MISPKKRTESSREIALPPLATTNEGIRVCSNLSHPHRLVPRSVTEGTETLARFIQATLFRMYQDATQRPLIQLAWLFANPPDKVDRDELVALE